MADHQDIIGRRFQDDGGLDRHVWDVRDSRVHYFTKAPGSHWTPGHGFDDAPTLAQFRETCRLVGEQADPPVQSSEMHKDTPQAADLSGDF